MLLDGVPIAHFDHRFYHEKVFGRFDSELTNSSAQVSLVAQEPILYEGTVRENIAYGCLQATEEDILQVTHDQLDSSFPRTVVRPRGQRTCTTS